MRMPWSGVCLSWMVAVVGAAGASRAAPGAGREVPTLGDKGVPGGGFPPEGVEFLVVNPGYSVCLSASPSETGEGQPCDWEAPGAEQRWRYQDGQLVNVASGGCLLASFLVPCAQAARFVVSYELLAQRLVLASPRSLYDASCFVVGEHAGVVAPLGLAPLESRECGAEQFQSKWVLVPLPG